MYTIALHFTFIVIYQETMTMCIIQNTDHLPKTCIFLQLPEVNHAAEEEGKTLADKWKILLLQNIGLVMGFSVMLLLSNFAEKINFEGV